MANDNNNGAITIKLKGRIDSGNCAEAEQNMHAALAGKGMVSVVIDATDLEYISSAGLRVILRLKKAYGDLKITGVNSDVYEILEMTGFTEMMKVEKAYRVVSVEGCEVIGEGFNGKVYRIDRDNVVKTYKNADALAEIQHEREVARLALVLGVPTAISYDVVRVGESYGSVFELLNARSFAKILAKEPEKMDFCVKEYVKMLKKIHSIDVPEGKLPSIKQKTLEKLVRVKDSLPEGFGDKLIKMTQAIPDSNRMIHGDFHTKNIVLSGDEVLLIDMDTLSVGAPIFELFHMYNSYVGFSEYNEKIVLDFQGFPAKTSRKFWHDTLAAYFGTNDENVIHDAENKIKCLAYPYLMDWRSRHPSGNDEEDKATIALWKSRLIELLPQVENLDLPEADAQAADADELFIEAKKENLPQVTDFINGKLSAAGAGAKTLMQTELAVEEIFVNVASYAYAPGTGNVAVRVTFEKDPVCAVITFADRGVPYDPLKKEDPDITLSAEERQIGGLGIFLTKEIMDDISYEYTNGQNILTMKKNI